MYNYKNEKPHLFNEDGLELVVRLYKEVQRLAEVSHCCTIGAVIAHQTGDSWVMLAALDYLAEHGFISIERDRNRRTQEWIIRPLS